MKRERSTLIALVLLTMLVSCSPLELSSVSEATPTPILPLTHTPTSAPTNTPTPITEPTPTATLVPTFTPPPPTPTSTPSPALLEEMDAIELEVAFLRGLREISPITRTLITRGELAVYLERQFAEEYLVEEVEADVRVMAAFDFVPPDFDLRGLLLDLYSDQILGLYDDEKDTLYVVTEAAGDGLDLLAELTFAHEFTHGLQDVHFDLNAFVDEDQLNDDQILARMSLVEGDASLAMTQYVVAHLYELTSEDLAALESEELQGSQKALEAAPAIIRETFAFPYLSGVEFVSALYREGWDAVDAAFADPPQSTEQILHPEKYFSRDEPEMVVIPPLTDTLGAGWHLVEADTLGEFQLDLYLEQQVDNATAALASAGWDGDQYALYAQNQADVLVFVTAWDSPADREEFVAAYAQYAEGKYGQAATQTSESERWWQTPDQTAVLAWDGTTVWIILGPDSATVEKILNTSSATHLNLRRMKPCPGDPTTCPAATTISTTGVRTRHPSFSRQTTIFLPYARSSATAANWPCRPSPTA